MSLPTLKRKHKTLTIKQKGEILERLNRNESFNKLAREYGVGRSTIYDIKKNRENIQKFVSRAVSGLDKRKTFKKSEHPEVEEALYKWFLQEINNHTPVSGPMLAMKAKFFYKEITKKDDFVASKGWLERFKNRHGIRLMTPTYEKFSNDVDTSVEPHNCLISVTPEIIEEVVTDTQCPSKNLDVCYREEKRLEKVECLLSQTSDNGQEDNNEVNTNSPPVTANNVVDAFEVCMQWAKENGASYNDLLVLTRLRDRAVILCTANVKQNKIEE